MWRTVYVYIKYRFLLKISYTENIPCVLTADGSGVQCQDANCPYKEEQHRISLTIYIRSHYRLEAYTKSFYLREIGESHYLKVMVDFHAIIWKVKKNKIIWVFLETLYFWLLFGHYVA